ncbi:MAG: copper resistance protein NlpE N-terminal domain-containing protein [Cyclobacteriaceae bacterium]|nr:copper resistance protein NlpE N-terminal domain-containing protein [Cyclobacteriaceae bacterium]
MKSLKPFFFIGCLLPCIVVSSCSGAGGSSSEIVFVGSTPGDALIKSMLAIPSDTKVDFIRWNLKLNTGSFVLDIAFGESQPNTLGFKGGGEKRSFEGTYTVSRSESKNINGKIYHLKSSKLPAGISMVKLNDNLFHLLTPQNRLMIGNGGWSYTLNRKEPTPSAGLPTLTASSTLTDNTSLQVVFDGRTPCRGFAEDNNLTVPPDCFKLKWKLILNRDPKTLLPTTYQLKTTFNRESDIEGKWTIIKGTVSNPNTIIYQLYTDKQEKSFSLLAGDENVLFFLDKNNELYAGNEHFSFTLNKK